MADFTKINSRQSDQPRFPPVDSAEPANGQVVTYRLSPEEIAARYGPPVPRETRRKKLSRESLAEMLRTLTVGQVAERWRVPQKLIFELCDRYELELDDKNRLVTGGDDMAHGDKIKAAREKLPKEEFERLIWEMSDEKIAEAKGISYWQVRQLKEEYGLVGIIGRGGRTQFKKKEIDTMFGDNAVTAQAERIDSVQTYTEPGGTVTESVVNGEEPTPVPEPCPVLTDEPESPQASNAPGSRQMTIAQALELKEELIEEVASAETVLKPDAELAPRLERLLKTHIEECASTIQAIEEAFESITIEV